MSSSLETEPLDGGELVGGQFGVERQFRIAARVNDAAYAKAIASIGMVNKETDWWQRSRGVQTADVGRVLETRPAQQHVVQVERFHDVGVVGVGVGVGSGQRSDEAVQVGVGLLALDGGAQSAQLLLAAAPARRSGTDLGLGTERGTIECQ